MRIALLPRALIMVFSVLSAWALLPLSSLALVPSDDFSDGSIDPNFWTAAQAGSGTSLTEANGRLEISLPATSTGSSFGAGLVTVCQLRGDFDAQLDYLLLNWPSANGVRVGVGLGEGMPPVSPIVERVSFGRRDYLGRTDDVYLSDYGRIHGVTTTTDQSGTLRLVRVGDMITTYYWSGNTWVSLHTGSTTNADVHLSIGAWSHDTVFSDQDVQVGLDNFVVNKGELICPTRTDTTPPVIEATVTPGSDVNEWHNTDVTVSWAVTDPESGIASSIGCESTTLTMDTGSSGLTLTCSATNGVGLTESRSVTVRIDKTAPMLSCSVTPDMLRPANHKLVGVTATVEVQDEGSGPAGFRLVSVTSDESDDQVGDGHTASDIQGFVPGTADTDGQLRAERSGRGDGRVYTLTYESYDAAGNRAQCQATVKVPHHP